MRTIPRPVLLPFVALFVYVAAVSPCWSQVTTAQPTSKHRMVYSRPVPRWEPATPAAERWDEAMPTGNGRVGALVFGNIRDETILLNHDSLFLRTVKPTLPDVSRHAPERRRLVAEGRYEEAGQFFHEKLSHDYDHKASDSFHPAFDVTIETPVDGDTSEAYRLVDFETAEASVKWEHAGVVYERKVFVSRADDVVVVGIRASKPGRISCRLGLLPTGLKRSELSGGRNVRIPRFPVERVAKIRLDEVPITFNLSARENLLTLVGQYDGGGPYRLVGGGEFGGCARVLARGGQVETSGLQVHIEGADEVLALVKLFANEESPPALARLRRELEELPPDYERLLERHTRLHRELFLRVELDLGGREKFLGLSNEKLVNEANHGQGMNALLERMFDFGRYALITSSASDGMPANLQGIWNGLYGPPWAADYHTDINIQMNYFQALSGNLAEITLSYFDYYESLLEDYRTNARHIYGCRGILASLGSTTHGLVGTGWTEWTAAAGWLGQLFHDYWLFTGDREFLRQRAVPFLREIAWFYEDFLTEGEDGRLHFMPSLSPENVPGNRDSMCTVDATMDIAVCREVLGNLAAACTLLGIEEEGVRRWREILAKLPPYRIEDGLLKEWSHPDFEDRYDHRLFCHLYPVFPGIEVTRERTPELFRACREAMAMKMREMEYPCAWTYALAASIYARLEQPEEALEALEIVARGYVLPNLFTTLWLYHHRPPMMQFEAASGIPAAMMDMLLYSEPGTIKLLPGLPAAWASGQITGLRARGGFEVSLHWKAGRLERALIRSLLGNHTRIRYRGRVIELPTEPDGIYRLDGNLERL